MGVDHRHLVIHRIREGEFQLAGTEAWTLPATSSMVAHDVFHHAPDDTGSFSDEPVSFGIQAWMGHRVDDLRFGIDHTELCAVLTMGAEAGSPVGVEGLPPAHPTVDLRFMKRFLRIAREAYVEASFDEALAHIDDATMGNLCDRPHLRRCAAWMSWGMRQAQERFPDPQCTLILFHQFTRAVRHWDHLPDAPNEATFLLDERRSLLWSPDPWMAQLMLHEHEPLGSAALSARSKKHPALAMGL